MRVLVVIPSRIGSTRLKEKPLVDLCGKPLIQRVYEGASQSKLADKVLVATDSDKIAKACVAFGAEVMMTPSTIQTGSDRVAYVAQQLLESYDMVVNVQGDEPFCTGEMVDELISSLKEDTSCVMSTLKVKFQKKEDILNPNLVKVIVDKDDCAIYFSRSVIPFNRENLDNFQYYRHLGYYAYSSKFLVEYSKMEQTPLETMEMLEQLRVLENGYRIKVVETKNDTIEINTPEDIESFEKKYFAINS